MEHGEYQQVIIESPVINNFVMEIGAKLMINSWTFRRIVFKAKCFEESLGHCGLLSSDPKPL